MPMDPCCRSNMLIINTATEESRFYKHHGSSDLSWSRMTVSLGNKDTF
jgi:hypothetical protein